jgi:hypothetical protein
VPQYNMSIFQLHPESRIGEVFYNLALHLDHIVFRHIPSNIQLTAQ